MMLIANAEGAFYLDYTVEHGKVIAKFGMPRATAFGTQLAGDGPVQAMVFADSDGHDVLQRLQMYGYDVKAVPINL